MGQYELCVMGTTDLPFFSGQKYPCALLFINNYNQLNLGKTPSTPVCQQYFNHESAQLFHQFSPSVFFMCC